MSTSAERSREKWGQRLREVRKETASKDRSSSWRSGDRSNSLLPFHTVFLPSFALTMSTSIPSFCFFLLLATAVRGNGEQNVILLLHLHPQYIPVSWLTPALLYAESLCSYFTSTVGSSRPYAYDGLDFKRVVLTIHITHWRPKQAHFSIKHWKLHVSTFLTDFVI